MTAKPKKSAQTLLRWEPEFERDFNEAVRASDLSVQDALRLAAAAMVAAYRRFGRIPHDMEVRQIQIGDLTDVKELLDRIDRVAETQANWITKPPKRSRTQGAGPDATISKPA